ncbi:MAG TPA: hypothetical protein VFC73_09780 [Syntrophomonadaceae bacterium]|nr:hypothetical protein [Syntrophomonadaceae bacterium]
MENTYLSRIIANYQTQYDLYNQVKELSFKQVEIFQDIDKDISYILNTTLNARMTIMNEIAILNEDNKDIQNFLLTSLDKKEFVISQLEGLVAEDLINELKKVILALGDLLAQINSNDKLNEILLKQTATKKPDFQKANSITKVSNAYKKAMEKPE